MIHRITLYGEPILRQTTVPITTFDDALTRLALDMIETMRAADGIGLAAPQINLNQAICVVDVAPLAQPGARAFLDGRLVPIDLLMPLVLVNPRILNQGPERGPYREGCLSIPDVHLDVIRPLEITVSYQDLAGVSHQLETDGIFARCLQHEIDHLNGVLFVDRIPPTLLAGVRTRLKKLQRASRDFLKSESKE